MLESPLLHAITALALCVQDPPAAPTTERGAKAVGVEQTGFRLDYTARHALVIGIDKYEDLSFPKLSYAVADAKGIADLLIKQFGFKPENVTLLVNEQATKAQISKALMKRLTNPNTVSGDDLVIVFFAGHGETQPVYRGSHGYLVPVDGRRDRTGTPEWDSLFGMSELRQASEAIPAKHALFLLDCCFGGLVTERAAPLLAAGLNRRARQVITGGSQDQTVQDGGAEGHSIFTGAMLDGMKGLADANADHIVTFGELYDYVGKRVPTETSSKQIPLQGHFPDHDGGSIALFAPGVEPTVTSAAERLKQVLLDKDALLAENERLSDIITVEELEKAADALWPRRPGKIPKYRNWLGKSRMIRARLPEHEQSLQRIQQEAFLSQVVAGLIEEKESSQVIWDKVEPWLQLRHRQFQDLVNHLHGLDPLIADIESRLEIASVIEAKTIDEQTDAWNEATDSIAKSVLYHGLELEPQMGLVPLGADPDSKLWEFWVWESGERPERDENTKRWQITGETGIVLVLLPGGTFSMGSQKENPLAPNYDPELFDNEKPVHQVTLKAYFLSKYELTQGQWRQVMGSNPSWFKHEGEPNAGAHPVEQVSYDDCVPVLMRVGLVLPTEAQWEYGARGGTTTRWWTGATKDPLKQAANLADESYRKGNREPNASESWDDGYSEHAPVGSLRANGFGLHDTAGNVWEWCRDWNGPYTQPVKPDDGERMVSENGDRDRVIRGGSFFNPAVYARSAFRIHNRPAFRWSFLGVRPARAIFHD